MWREANLEAPSFSRQLSETLRFEDENDYEYKIWFKVFSRIVQK